ncbi:YfhO family protein [Streptococcus didelphis]|uniref:YfhO family protein n=1 Tax=Streptococcus didelphis TaxID=102886 RepID=A0ABY9LIU3_9STRE|nr:YfhO family protein [Streptococcus didelphis]WMB28807.1 YfhO family protein [Streptococcus didelphis]
MYVFTFSSSVFFSINYSKKGWKKQLKLFIKFTSISLCSVLASAFMLIPTYLDLSSHGEELTRFTNLFTSNTWYFDLFSKSLIGVYDTTKFNSIPMLYGGLLPLLLSLLFFTLKSISFKTKISYFLLLLIIIMSYYIEPLSLFWQGMHAPNMFLHRYFWTLPLLSTLLACETLNHKNELTYKSIVFVFILVNLSLALPYLYLERYKFLDISFFLLSFSSYLPIA